MRARLPDSSGLIQREGISVGYEVFGEGEPTVLFLPTWTIVHSRVWKLQVPYLSRRFRVITYDGPGNGLSDRVTDPERFSVESEANDALAVLDECDVEQAVVVGYSDGGRFACQLAHTHPDRVAGLVLIAPNLGLGKPRPERQGIKDNFFKPYPDQPRGWQKYNAMYWRDHYEDFVGFFMSELFSEPHTTKQWEDAVGWGLETEPEVLIAEMQHPRDPDWEGVVSGLQCPILLIHGTDDGILSHAVSVEAARIAGAHLLSLVGSGHGPQLKDPVRVNLAIREYMESVAV